MKTLKIYGTRCIGKTKQKVLCLHKMFEIEIIKSDSILDLSIGNGDGVICTEF